MVERVGNEEGIDFGTREEAADTILVAQADTGTTGQPASNAPTSATETRIVVELEDGAILRLPATASVDQPRENGTDLEFVQPDGTVIVVPNGAIQGLTIFIGTAEIPPLTVAALFESNGIEAAAGPAGAGAGARGSGGNFEVPVGGIGDAFAIGNLLDPTALAFGTPENEELYPAALDDEPTIGANGAVFLDDDNLAGSGGFGLLALNEENHSVSGRLAFDYGDDGEGSVQLSGAVFPSGLNLSFQILEGGAAILILQGDRPVVQVQLTDTVSGNFIVTQLGPVNHPDGTTEDEIAFGVSFTVTDRDGDAATGLLSIVVDDDIPEVSLEAVDYREGEGQTSNPIQLQLDETVGKDRGANNETVDGNGASDDVNGKFIVTNLTTVFDGATGKAFGSLSTGTGQEGSGAALADMFASSIWLGADGGEVFHKFNLSLTDAGTEGEASAGVKTNLKVTALDGTSFENSDDDARTIYLYQDGDAIVGRVGGLNGYIALIITISGSEDPSTASLSVHQLIPLEHFDTDLHDEQLALALVGQGEGDSPALSVTYTIKAVDGDGDEATQSASIVLADKASTSTTGAIVFDDDGPSVIAEASEGLSLVHDESLGRDGDADDVSVISSAWQEILNTFISVQNRGEDPDALWLPFLGRLPLGYAKSDSSALSFVSEDYGSDGAAASGARVYSLTLTNSDGTATNDPLDSGLKTTNGTPIFLFLESGFVVGRYDGSAADGEVGSNDPAAFAIRIGDDGKIAVLQYVSLQHEINPDSDDPIDLSEMAGRLNAVVTITDGDGDNASSSVDIAKYISFEDDGPRFISAGLATKFGLLIDETPGNQAQSDDTSGPLSIFDDLADKGGSALGYAVEARSPISFHSDYGVDGEGATPVAYALKITDADSGLTLTDGSAIELSAESEGGVSWIVGRVAEGEHEGKAAFAIHIDPTTGHVSVVQYLSLKHVAGNSDDVASLAGDSLAATITITDGDGDAVSRTFDISGKISFRDDGPDAVVDGSVTLPGLTVDESNGSGSGQDGKLVASASFAGNFGTVVDYGADGAGSVSYALQLKGPDVGSGLYAVAPSEPDGKGAQIVLNESGGVVTGSLGGVTYFTISVDVSGNVTFTLTGGAPIWHANTGNHDDASTLKVAADKLLLTQTVTDGDNDKDSASIDIGSTGVFTVEDDGPRLNLLGSVGLDNSLFFDNFALNGNAWGLGSGTASGAAGEWVISDAGGGGSGPVELQRVGDGYLGMHSSTRGYMVDLNASNKNIAISQVVEGLSAGKVYNLTFEAGSVLGQGDSIEVYFGSQLVATITSDTPRVMTSYTFEIVGGTDDASNTLVFKEVGSVLDNHGTYLANVRVSNLIIIDETAGPDGDSNDTSAPAIVDLFDAITGYAGVNISTANYAAGSTPAVNAQAYFGADGPSAAGGLEFALQVNPVHVTGLKTTDGLHPITLTAGPDGLVLGVYDGGKVAFALHIGDDGVISVAQYTAIWHPDTGNHDEGTFLQPGSVTVVVTATDSDGDSVTQTADASGLIRFEDDGPRLIGAATYNQFGDELINNGSFENPSNVEGGWKLFTGIEGWNSNGGVPFEVQSNGAGGLGGANGTANLIELDSDQDSGSAQTNATIAQTIETVAGQTYSLTFQYAARPGHAADNGMIARVNGQPVFTLDPDAEKDDGWQSVTVTFTATGTSTTISFTGTGTPDEFGIFLDEVSVRQVLGLDDDSQVGGIDGGPGDDANGNVAIGKINFDAGSDGLQSITATGVAGLQAIFVDPVTGIGTQYLVQQEWFPDAAPGKGGTLVGTIDTNGAATGGVVDVYTLAIDANGNYTLTIKQPLVHPGADNPGTPDIETAFEDNIQLGFGFTITDGDGDTVSETLTFNVDDDTPDFVDGGVEDVTVGTVNVPQSGDLNIAFGADGQKATGGLKISGYPKVDGVFTELSEDGLTLTGYLGSDQGPELYTLKLNPETLEYSFTQHQAMPDVDSIATIPLAGNGSAQTIDFGGVSFTALAGGHMHQTGAGMGIGQHGGGHIDHQEKFQIDFDNAMLTTELGVKFEGNGAMRLDWVAYKDGAEVASGSTNPFGENGLVLIDPTGPISFDSLVLTAEATSGNNPKFKLTGISGQAETQIDLEHLNFTVMATDGDGDSVSSDFIVTLKSDDKPKIEGVPSSLVLDEDTLPAGNDDSNQATEQAVTEQTTGSVVVDFGNDVPANLLESFSFLTTGLNNQLQTSTGTSVTFSIAQNGDLVGTAAGNEVVRITVTGAVQNGTKVTYTYEASLNAPLEHSSNPNEDSRLLENVGFEIEDATGDKTAGNFDVTVWDDVPTAVNQAAEAVAGVRPSVNIVLVIDTSGSMGDGSTEDTAMYLAKQAAINLLNSADVDFNQIMVVQFNGGASTNQENGSAWTSKAHAIDYIDGLDGNGSTNYDAALNQVMTNWGSGPTPATQTLTYFISDGQPTVSMSNPNQNSDNNNTKYNASLGDGIGEDGIAANNEISRQEWEAFLLSKGVTTSYAIGVGDLSQTHLEPISWAPGNAALPPVVISSANQLELLLTGSLPGNPSGNIFDGGGEFGADGGHIASFTYAGVTFSFDGDHTITRTGTNTNISWTINANGQQITINDALSGKLIFNFAQNGLSAAGDWDYYAPTNNHGQLNFDYLLKDNDGDTADGTLTIDVQLPPMLAISSPEPVTEGADTHVVFTVSLGHATLQPVIVNLSLGGGTATGGADYGTDLQWQNANGDWVNGSTVTFAPGQTSINVRVAVIDDAINEPTESFNLTATAVSGTSNGTANSTGVIIDNGDAQPSISISDVTVAEGGLATFTVTLSGSSGKIVTVNYATGNGTATSTSDYTATSGTLTFAPGETTKTITVQTTQDSKAEAQENFVVNLTTPTNASIANSQGTGTVTDKDTNSFAVSDVSIMEGNSGTKVMTFTVTRTGTSEVDIQFNWSSANGTATSGSDYVAGSGVVTFPAGSGGSQTFSVTINGDTTHEPNETFTVTLVPVGASADYVDSGSDLSATGTITNDDASPNQAPAGVADRIYTNASSKDSGTSITLQNDWLVRNDTDSDGGSLNVKSAANGTSNDGVNAGLVTTTTTTITVDLVHGENGNFSYVATDNIADSANTTVTVHRSSSNDSITGSSGNDIVIDARNQNTTLSGDDGNDILVGGTGADTLSGGTGEDIFVFRSKDSTVSIGGSNQNGTISGFDKITDFNVAEDKLVLNDTAFAASTVGIVDGTNSSLTHGPSGNGHQISRHSISNGMISFYKNGGDALGLTSEAHVAAVVQYLRAQDLGNAGATVAFTATYGGNNYTFIYQQVGSTPNSTDDILIRFADVTINNLSTLIANGTIDPIILDLDGTGFTFSELGNGVRFDINGDGKFDQMAWNSSSDGILVYDLNGNGTIDDGSELFTPWFNGGNFANGSAALASLDTNGDGVIDVNDEAFSKLQTWQDANGDGISGADELKSLADHGITSLSASTNTTSGSIDGQAIVGEGTFTRADGSNGSYVEVLLDGVLGSGDAPSGETIIGPDDDDFLTGTDGDDIIIGGLGNDVLTGGAGADTFVFSEAGLDNVDTITDFVADEDAIDLGALLDAALINENNIGDYVRIQDTGADALLQVDTTGTGSNWVDVANLNGHNNPGTVIDIKIDDQDHQIPII